MGKGIKRTPWTRQEDDFLREHFDTLGDFIGVHDLGRQPGAATERVRKLKRRGQWIEKGNSWALVDVSSYPIKVHYR